MAITIGADPEFALVKNNSVERFYYDYTSSAGTIKPDHCGQVGEFNPSANEDPSVVVNNLRKLILKTKEHYGDDYKIIAGGNKNNQISTGGHIHISDGHNEFRDFTINDYSWRSRSNIDRIDLTTPGNKLILTLDTFIGSRLQKLINGKRNDRSYNKLSKIKRKTYGGDYNVSGFEYRSSPSFITTPQLVESTLATTQQIVKLWATKSSMFDSIISRNSRDGTFSTMRRVTAKSRDYNLLIPNGQSTNERYYRNQIRYFMSIVFNREFDLGDPRLIEYWTNSVVDSPEVRVTLDSRIALQPCQIKVCETETDFVSNEVKFENETVLKAIMFAKPEVKIYPVYGAFVPWIYRLNKERRLRENTIYFSKTLKPFITMPRGQDIKLRFVDFSNRSDDLENAIFFSATNDKQKYIDFIERLFTENVRTKLRRKDAIAH